jgi:coiled-coil domain-containing protein 12
MTWKLCACRLNPVYDSKTFDNRRKFLSSVQAQNMASTHTTLDAAAVDRKARLAKLASLKRKQPSTDTAIDESTAEDGGKPSQTPTYLSGRNYDVQTRGPKLGFENAPSADVTTLEQQADVIASATAIQAAKDEAEVEKGIDLFKLQPKKPNWDLKRDLAEKMKILDVRTQNAIARLVKERIENAKKEVKKKGKQVETEGNGQGEEVGIDGNALVEGVHLREKEKEEDERRERELDKEDGIP